MVVNRWRRTMQAVEGRPLATICACYMAGSAAGVTFSALPVLQSCIAVSAGCWFIWRCQLLSARAMLLALAAMWLGAVQGIKYSQAQIVLSRVLPAGEAVTLVGEVATEPSLRRGTYRFVFRAESTTWSNTTLRTPVQVWVSLPQSAVQNLYCGERLRLYGRLRAPEAGTRAASASFVQYLRRQGIVRTMQPLRVQRLPESGWRVHLSQLRQALLSNLRAHLPTREGHIAAAIVLNDRTGLDADLREGFRRTGTIHILSPSGTHVSMLALATWVLSRWLKVSRRASAVLVIAVIWGFVGVASGGEPSVRAGVMGTLVAGAIALQRELDMPTSLGVAAFLLVCWDVGTLRDPGFQFSFTLVAAIVASSEWLKHLVSGTGSSTQRLPREILAAFCLSMVCAIASAPLTALYYGQMSLVAPIANLLIVVPVQVVTCGGLLLALTPPLPEFVGTPVTISVWLVERLVRLLAEIPYASVPAPPPSHVFIGAFYAVFFSIMLALSARASRRRDALTW